MDLVPCCCIPLRNLALNLSFEVYFVVLLQLSLAWVYTLKKIWPGVGSMHEIRSFPFGRSSLGTLRSRHERIINNERKFVCGSSRSARGRSALCQRVTPLDPWHGLCLSVKVYCVQGGSFVVQWLTVEWGYPKIHFSTDD